MAAGDRVTPADALAASEVLQRREHVAVIGGGTIGASWSALFLAHGLEVRLFDPAPDVEERVRALIEGLAPILRGLGLPTDQLSARLRFAADLEAALDGA